MANFGIIVAQRVLTRLLSKQDDRANNPRGCYEISAPSEERALETFHNDVPIACLDDFEIIIKRLTPLR